MIVAGVILAASVFLLIAPGMTARAAAVDAQGDPLPPGAVLRLGNVRFLHGGMVRAVAYSPDGKTLATVADDYWIRLWEVDSGKEVQRMPGPQDVVVPLAFSPSGKLLASGGEAVVHLWDVRTGKEAGRLAGHERKVRALAFSPDDRLLATGGEARTVRLWDVRTCKEVRRCPGNPGAVSALCFFPDGARLVMGSDDAGIHVWQMKGAGQMRRLLAPRRPRPDTKVYADRMGVGILERPRPVEHFRTLVLSPDGRTLLSEHGVEDEDKRDPYRFPFYYTLYFWDTVRGEKLGEYHRYMDGFDDPVFSPDGALLVSSGRDGLDWWDTVSRRIIRKNDMEWMAYCSLAFSPDGKTLACGCFDHRVRLLDVRTGKQKKSWPGHARAVDSVAFAPDGKSLATASWDRTVRTWQLPTGKQVLCLQAPNRGSCGSLSYSHDGSILGAVGTGRTAYLWRAGNGELLRHYHLEEKGQVGELRLLPDGRALLVCQKEQEKELFLWDLARGRRAGSLPAAEEELHYVGLSSLVLSPDGQYLLGQTTHAELHPERGFYQELTLWSWRSGQELRVFRKRLSDTTWHRPAAFSGDSRLLAMGTGDETLCVREVPGGGLVSRLPVDPGRLRTLAFSPDRRTLAAGHREGQVSVWEVATGRQVCRFEGHLADVLEVTFAPDGRLLASASEDATVLVWDLAAWLRGPESGRLSQAQRGRLWSQLGDPDAAVAYRAVARLAAAPGQAVPLC